MQNVKAVTLRYRPFSPSDLRKNGLGSLEDTYTLQSKVLLQDPPLYFPKLGQYTPKLSPRIRNTPKLENKSMRKLELFSNDTCSPLPLSIPVQENIISQEHAKKETKKEEVEDVIDIVEEDEDNGELKSNDVVSFYADSLEGESVFTIGVIYSINQEKQDAAVQLLAQRYPYIDDSPLFKHCAGITLSVPLTGLQKWDKSEEILNDSPIAYMNASQPSQELDNTYDLNYCPVGVIQITLDVASRENFYNKWTKAKAIVIGCIYTQAKTTFRNIPFIQDSENNETNGTSVLVGFGFCLDNGDIYFLDLRKVTVKRSVIMQILAPIFESSIDKICVNSQLLLESIFDCLWEIDDILELKDPLIAAWVNNTERDILFKNILSEFLLDLMDTEDGENQPIFSQETAERESIRSFYSDLQYVNALHQIIIASLDEREVACYTNIEMPCSIILAKLCQKEINVDRQYVKECKKKIDNSINFLKTQENNQNVMQQINYLGSLLKQLILLDNQTTKSGFIKTHWNLFSDTGMIRCHDYNIQDLPSEPLELLDSNERTILHLRHCIKAKEDHQFVYFSYLQLELRIIAHFSEDEMLINLFANDIDPILFYASKCKKKPSNNITQAEKLKLEKVILYIIYGYSDQLLAETMNISVNAAGVLIRVFHEIFPKVSNFNDSIIEYWKQNGYISTIFGRKRFISTDKPDYHAIEAVIKGSAIDILKSALISCYSVLQTRFPPLQAQLVLLLDNGIIFHSPTTEVKSLIDIISETMVEAPNLTIPITIFTHIASKLETNN